MLKRTHVSILALLAATGLLVPALAQQPANPPANTGNQRPAATMPAEKVEKVPAQPIKGQIVKQPEHTIMSSELIGAAVRANDQTVVGSVDGLIMTRDGAVQSVVLQVGGFLGIGSRKVAMAMDTVKIELQEGKPRVDVSASKEELEKAPQLLTLAAIKREREAEDARSRGPAPASKPAPGTQRN